MLVLVQMLQAVCVEARGAANDAVHIIALRQQQFGPVEYRVRMYGHATDAMDVCEKIESALTGTIHLGR